MKNSLIKGNWDNALDIASKELRCDGIGTYNEKLIHSTLKFYFEPSVLNHEIKFGRMVADIMNENGIIEIQTRAFNNMRSKLEFFLKNTPVTIVYPYPTLKWLKWLDPETGEITTRRKSPKKWTIYDSFYELYKIRNFLSNPNLHIYLIGMELEEVRILNGWSKDRKKGSERLERYPLKIIEELNIISNNDYLSFIPPLLPTEFTSADYARCAGISKRIAGYALSCLLSLNIIKRVGKIKNSYVYTLKQAG